MASTPSHQENGKLSSRSHVWHTTYSFTTSMSLKCALELGIPDAIHRHAGRPVTATQLAADLGIPASRTTHLGRLMRALERAGYFEKCTTGDDGAGEDGYVLTPSSAYLRDEGGPFPLMNLHSVMLVPWLHLSEWFRRDDDTTAATPFHVAHQGMGLWQVTATNPGFDEVFNVGIAHDADLVAAEILASCGPILAGARSLVDVGGGNGALARAIAADFPDVKCAVLDLPHVVSKLPPSERVQYLGGNMFEYIPKADVVLLKQILHDYNDEDCVKILKQCKKAIPSKGGKVIVYDIVVNVVDEENIKLLETQIFLDMYMMVVTGGREREEKEWANIFVQAGFTSYKITPIAEFQCLLEVFP